MTYLIVGCDAPHRTEKALINVAFGAEIFLGTHAWVARKIHFSKPIIPNPDKQINNFVQEIKVDTYILI